MIGNNTAFSEFDFSQLHGYERLEYMRKQWLIKQLINRGYNPSTIHMLMSSNLGEMIIKSIVK